MLYWHSSSTSFSSAGLDLESSLLPSFSVPSCNTLYFLLDFLLLLAFFLLLMPVFNAFLLSGPFSASSIFSPKRRRAVFRFCSRERVAWHLTTMPVGMCFSWTAEEVLFYSSQSARLHNPRYCKAGLIFEQCTDNFLASRTTALQESFFNIRLSDDSARR